MKMLIGGKKVDASNGATFDVINPATLQVIDTCPAATKEDIDLVLNNAREGFKEWSATPLFKRIEILKNFMEIYKSHIPEMAETLMKEVGKPIGQAKGEVSGQLFQMEAYLEAARFLGGETIPENNRPSTAGTLIINVREPIGVYVGILPNNYPVSQMCHRTMTSLVMGNACIIKPASDTPLTNLMFGEYLLEAGIPGNAFQMVTGSGSELGALLTDDRRVDIVSLVGSTEAGITTACNSAKHLHHVGMELGGNDPVVILPDADLDVVTPELIFARLTNSGQVCCAAKRILVHNSLMEELSGRIVEELKKKKVGDPSDPTVDCGPVVSVKAAKEIERQINLSVEQGGKILLGGHRYQETYIEPTVMIATPDMDVAQSMEIFGPVFTLIGFETIEEALEIANNSDYGLSSGVFGKDIASLLKVAKGISAGNCVINGSSFFRSQDQSFGGNNLSGCGGREGGYRSLEAVSQLKSIVFKKLY